MKIAFDSVALADRRNCDLNLIEKFTQNIKMLADIEADDTTLVSFMSRMNYRL